MDILKYFSEKHSIKADFIENYCFGEKYFGIMLKNGNIGVSAILGNEFKFSESIFTNPNIDNYSHRIVINAYLNAYLNYIHTQIDESDIFDDINFQNKDNIVMIGFFASLAQKFYNKNINIKIFDTSVKNSLISPISEMFSALSKANTIIITSTTIANKTLERILLFSSKNSEILMLGPSSILHHEMFLLNTNLVKIYGSLFDPFNNTIFDLIKSNKGTPAFLPYMKKVFISKL